MRLFVSIDFPETVRQELQSWIPDLNGWKKESTDQLHMTLAFLGECNENQKEDVHSRLKQVEFSPFSLSVVGLGAFPNKSRPRIIWAGMSDNSSLINLQENISDTLAEYLNSDKKQAYVPHITLARKKSGKEADQVVKKTLRNKTGELEVNINHFHLKESILKPEGSVHHILAKYQAVQ